MSKDRYAWFDRVPGPWLFHKLPVRFRWREGRVKSARFIVQVNPFSEQLVGLDPGLSILVARAGPFSWRVDVPRNWRRHALWPRVQRILEYHLSDLEGRYPPNYLIHHCSSTANVYSGLSWSMAVPPPDGESVEQLRW